MIKRFKTVKSCGIITIPALLIFVLFINVVSAFSQPRQLNQEEFSKELGNAYTKNDDGLVFSLIKEHRLFVKQFVNDLIDESISNELKGKTLEALNLFTIAEKAATSFENIFGEKSLAIAINYLKNWSYDQKQKKLVADSLYEMATKFRLGYEPQKAIEYCRKASDLYTGIQDERGEAEILGSLGAIYFDLDYQKSLAYFQEALVKREKIDDKKLVGNTLSSLGSVYFKYFDDYPRAISWYDKAEAIRTEIGDLSGLRTVQSLKASAFIAYGETLNNLGKYPEALENIEKALEINRKIDSRPGIANALNQIGFVYSNLGDYNTAFEKVNEAGIIFKEEGDMQGLAGVYNHLGIILQKSGKVEKATEYYNNSLKIREEVNDQQNVIAVLSNLGTLFFDTRDYKKAEEYHFKALQISREIKDKSQEVNCLLNLANDQSVLGELDEAGINYKSGLIIARSLNSPDLIWRITVGLAEIHKRREEFDKAVELNDSALKILEGIRSTLQSEELKASYIASERYVFEDVINMLGKLNEKDNTKGYDLLAFEYAERSKSRAFLDLLAESVANIKEGADSALVKRQEGILAGLTQYNQLLEEESLKEQADAGKISGIKEKTKELEEELAAVKKEIRNTNPRFADLKYPETVSLDEVQSMCPDKNTVILEYFVGDSSSCLWVITKSDYKLFMLPNRDKLQEQVAAVGFALQDPSPSSIDFLTGAGYSLYTELIKPAEPYFSKKSNLVIIPDGILYYIPFEVLITEPVKMEPEALYSELPFMVKRYPVSYEQSASVMKSLVSEKEDRKKSGSGIKRLVAFGDPVYENDTAISFRNKYKRLEYSGTEVKNIASLFKNDNARIYLMKDATEENVKRKGALENFNYIHFATHGYVDETNPDFSCLVLTKGTSSEEDGLLQATEIFNLNLDADLVVLSACQTGLGKLVRGEGIVGLTRAFMYAGTPTVMVSLWSVSDISTATLMKEFYEKLVKENLSKTESLRKAQLAMLRDEKFAHPFYWAPFVIFGDWR